ncbi:MAG TPA: DUF6580 family putative transport protein [Bacteroidota bacterium]|nr:DUF6580 family putative transport protein [Bacteroidota bacterium]
MIRTLFLLSLAALAVVSRLVPHPMNFAPIAALALFGGAFFDRRFSFVLPFAVLLVSDWFIGFYDGVAWVYGAFFLVNLVGWWLRGRRSLGATAGATLTGSVLFFIVTNFGVWLQGSLYSPDFAGLVTCYVAAMPFFRNTLAGDAFYVAVLFGLTELAARKIPALGIAGATAGK